MTSPLVSKSLPEQSAFVQRYALRWCTGIWKRKLEESHSFLTFYRNICHSEYMPWQKQRTKHQTPCKLLDRRRLSLSSSDRERIMWSRRTRPTTCSGCRLQLCVPPHAQSVRCSVCGAVTRVGGSQDTLRQAMGFLRSIVTNISNANSSFASSFSSDLNGYNYPTANLPFPRVHGKKRAVLVGITYTGQRYVLKGTVNDVNCMRFMLTERFGFPEACILVLTELERDPRRMPTKENLRAAMLWLVDGCKAGDSLVFHYSGHGVQKLDPNGEELDGYNEALCPLDFETQGTIVDDEVNNILVRPLRPGVKLHALVDACHSGTVLDLPYHCRLSRAGYYQWQNHMPQNTYKGTTGGLAILISGCDDDQTSADTTTFAGSTSTGAMTYSFIQAVENEPGTTYGNLLMAMRSAIREGSSTGIRLNGPIASLMRRVFNFGLKQEPQLSSSEMFDIYRKPFLL